jgi:hypothetical protein
MEMNQIMENWSETKEVLLDGLDSTKRDMVGPLLENQRNYIMKESAAAGAVQAHDIANFRKTLLPMIRRIIPGTIASEIVGVQPMSGPVSLVYTLRYKYAEEMQHDPSRSPFGGFDIEEGDEAFGNEKLIRQFYSGQVGDVDSNGNFVPRDQLAGSSGIANPNAAEDDIDPATAFGEGWRSERDATTYETGETLYGNPVGGSLFGGSGSTLEGTGGRKMTLEIINQAVEAGTRRLQAGWTIEAMQDMNSQHGLDIESELTKALSAEIVQEIDAEIIADLLALAGTVRTFDFSATSGTTYAPAFVGDRFANLGVRINEVANEIARKTRRGAGNFIVVSPMIVSVLQSAAKSVFAPAVEGSFKGPNNTQLAGTLNGQIKVYSYLWNQAQSLGSNVDSSFIGQGLGEDQILVGYKGGNGETDCGYWYAPYIPLMSSGVIVHPVTFQPVMSLMTRYGKVALTDRRTSLGNSADYYGKVNVTTLDFQ